MSIIVIEEEEDDDDDFLSDDDDQEFQRLREARLRDLKKQNELHRAGYGEYREILETEFLNEVTKCEVCLVVFYKDDFESCKILDMHMKKIAPHHMECKFLHLNAEKSPFFVQKLAIRTLPTTVIFRDGISIDRITGFEDFDKGYEVKTREIEHRIAASGIMKESEIGIYPEDEEEDVTDTTSRDFKALSAASIGY